MTLFEATKSLGGRVTSFHYPDNDLVIDNCTHVLLGCCTEAIGLLRRLGSLDQVEFHDRVNVVGGGSRLTIEASRLPAPLHLAPSITRTPYLSATDKVELGQTLTGMLTRRPRENEAALAYLTRLGCSDRLVDRMIGPVVESALNENAREASAKYARMVLLESFVKGRHCYRLGVPKVPQSVLIGGAAMRWLESRGCELRLLGRVSSIHEENGLARWMELASGERLEFDAYVMAVPPWALAKMGVDARGGERLTWKPIVSAHLFFGRPTPSFEPACAAGEPFGWVFSRRPDVGHVEVVASAAGELIGLGKSEVLDMAVRAAGAVEPRLLEMPLRDGIVYRAKNATFATLSCDANRPGAVTPTANLFLAGDWTDTGWPATIESAVRSGHAAARALLAS